MGPINPRFPEDGPLPDVPDPALVEFAGGVFEACASVPDRRAKLIARSVCLLCAKYGIDLGLCDADEALQELGLARLVDDPDEGGEVMCYWGEARFGK